MQEGKSRVGLSHKSVLIHTRVNVKHWNANIVVLSGINWEENDSKGKWEFKLTDGSSYQRFDVQKVNCIYYLVVKKT